jgi:serine/threonine protein kinase
LTLIPGTRVGVYEVAQIGEGGMGKVYCATDSSLKRSVAIRVLPASMAGDADRLARFHATGTGEAQPWHNRGT